ncbi:MULTISPECIES: class I SAM-dependent methyltransferase [Streptomycetaceae]|uniref:SAM-dependent methyltransferase n=1 Tax=Streptantibioticus cattleyicolor (strain ATCC 35852 / DSM 46488 / JCM 4925 / NBRC 14057 / NRRL 8057) TaxID=1003195 RepID=F8JTM9_STREN|nr:MULTISPECIES: class I SAM-dependent methyltransferase [Streptomycetaceae]AEW96796.1 hypothetical protein SCATT_44250 [Streptantibioticus cattleyicolor NRRL 8057 = DSM 46488]MYS61277.1 SAM-dependent methyltransferase [Streptomyces sp. SID5468]CCB77126.1 conserved protein of unknown function [Streptantibioticus cattleyicolor NRRL 8057 = DSM 46488]
MTPTLAPGHVAPGHSPAGHPRTTPGATGDPAGGVPAGTAPGWTGRDLGAARSRVRDWAEIQERMLVPLVEAVYARLDVGAATRLLAVGCGSGLALLMAAARGAEVTGYESDGARLALARERLLGPVRPDRPAGFRPRLLPGHPERAADGAAFTMVTVFEAAFTGGAPVPSAAVAPAAALAADGSPVVLAGWGPPERCATTGVLRSAGGTAGTGADDRDELETAARDAGLRPDGSGRVSCPFAYPDLDSAVRGLLSTGLLDAAVAADATQTRKELTEALQPYRRPDGTVRMENVLRYLIARA